MPILTNTGGIAATNCYLVADEAAKLAVLFDAPDHTTTPLLDECSRRGWTLQGLWLTHGHFDHLADHAVVTSRFPTAKVLIHELDAPKLQNPTTRLFQLPFTIPPRSPDATLTDGQRLSIGSLQVEVIHTPGHSPGHVMFLLTNPASPADPPVLIGGDLIIMHAVGRTDFPDCSYPALQSSIRRIMQLPPETRLLPGHGDPTTLAEELRTNPYVQEAVEASAD